MNKNMNIPKLRFKEFNGEWEEKKLGKIADISSGGTPLRNKPSYWNGTIPWVTTSLIDFRYICSAEEYITEEGLNNSSAKLFEKNTILMAMYGQGKTRGKVGVLKINATTNQACASINPKSIDYIFLYQYLMNQYDNIRNLSNEGGQKNLSASIIKNILIPYPSKQEQEKIASFLTSVDTKIEQLTKKEALLQEYKKGVMNKIFNQEIRFKDDDGSEFPEWEEKEIGNILKIGSGKDYKHLSDGNIPVYGTGGYMTSVNEYIYNGESVCIGRKGTIDKPVFLSGKFWTVDTLFYTHSFKDSIPKFVFSIFQTINWKLYNEASGVPSLSKSTIEKIKITIPSLKEQTKIANFLSSIDKKIELTTKELNSTKEFKKALLQQMFV